MRIFKTLSDNEVSVLDHDNNIISRPEDIVNIDTSFYTNKYGFDLNTYEINYFKSHMFIWKYFLENSNSQWCLIYENEVLIKAHTDEMEQTLLDLSNDTDLFIPYDKLGDYKQVSSYQISGTRLGFFWGSYIYFISRSGAKKMLNLAIIKQPLDETFLEASFTGVLSTIFTDTNWFLYDEHKNRNFTERRKIVYNVVMEQQAWLPKQKQQALDLLQLLIIHAERIGIKLMLHAGTLLGGIRHNRIMNWDDDIDIAMLATDLTSLIDAIKAEGIIKVTPWVYKKTGNTYYKFWLEGGEKVEGYEYAFPFIDIWLVYTDRMDIIHMTDGYVFPKNQYLKPKKIVFEGLDLYIPKNYKMVLDAMYKDWGKYIRIFAWCHRLKKPAFKKHVLPIEVNKMGRLRLL